MTKATLDRARTDQVGSFLRPAALKEAFRAYDDGEIDHAALGRVQDDLVREVIALQERRGLPFVNDGEFRRRQFTESFAEVAGIASWQQHIRSRAHARTRVSATPGTPEPAGFETRHAVDERLRLIRNAPLEEYQFAAAVASRPVKVTLIGPDRIAGRYDEQGSRAVYASAEEFLGDVVAIEQEIVAGLAAAGCRYIHIDAPGYTNYVDPPMIADMRARGEDPARLLTRSIAADNAVIANVPGVTFGVHLCRGNSNGQWHRQGAYDAIAEQLFNELRHDRFLLEYDDERSGGFEPLRLMPKGKTVVLGLISSKNPRVETVAELVGRIEEAARFIPVDQLAISPQCGFASNLGGNPLTEDEQWRKIDAMLETAQAVWG
jgi:5-methyltetrahydropteroyltriglutamate--homocysteine methyltransferase